MNGKIAARTSCNAIVDDMLRDVQAIDGESPLESRSNSASLSAAQSGAVADPIDVHRQQAYPKERRHSVELGNIEGAEVNDQGTRNVKEGEIVAENIGISRSSA